MRELTDKPFGVNVAQAFVRDPGIVQFVIDQGIKFVTTSAGDPMKYTAMLKAAGLTVFHVVPNLAGALRAVEAGVDGLVVEGGEGGGFKNPKDVASMVLIAAGVREGEGAGGGGGRHHGRADAWRRRSRWARRACRWGRAYFPARRARCTRTGRTRS